MVCMPQFDSFVTVIQTLFTGSHTASFAVLYLIDAEKEGDIFFSASYTMYAASNRHVLHKYFLEFTSQLIWDISQGIFMSSVSLYQISVVSTLRL